MNKEIERQLKQIVFRQLSLTSLRCVELIHLRTISLNDVSLPGIVYQVLLSNQNMSPRLNIILNLLIYRNLDLSSFLNYVF